MKSKTTFATIKSPIDVDNSSNTILLFLNYYPCGLFFFLLITLSILEGLNFDAFDGEKIYM